MDAKLLMVKAVTLIYLSTKIKDTSYDVHKIVSDVLVAIKPPENSVRAELTYDTTSQLRQCVINMLDESKKTDFNSDELKQRFKIITNDDVGIYEALTSILVEDEFDEIQLRNRFENEYWNIKRMLDQEALMKLTRDWSMRMAWNPESINWDTIIEDLKEDFSKFNSFTSKKDIKDHPAVYAVIDFSDKENVKNTLLQAKEGLSPHGTLKCGYQGINRMCGEFGGFRRGETLLISALRHNYKTGFSRDLFISIPLFNKPYMYDETKKPLNIRFSFEDMPNDDIIQVYKRLRQAVDGVSERTRDIDVEYAANYINEKLGVNGYTNIIVSIDPTNFSGDGIVNTLEQYMKQGYEIHHCNIDYLAMIMKNRSYGAGETSTLIQNLFTKLGNFCRRNKIFLSTPHQLGPEAKAIHNEGVSDFVKHVAGKSMYDASKRIDQEVEMEITVHIEKCNGEKYLTCQRGKHRGANETPEKDQYVAYKFNGVLGLPYDYGKDDMSLRKIGGDVMSDGGGSPLWDV